MADLKLKDLRYLVALADTRHFGQAAARCFVSQPTLSAQLKKLEEYLGVQLVERHPRRIALTEADKQVVVRARRIIEGRRRHRRAGRTAARSICRTAARGHAAHHRALPVCPSWRRGCAGNCRAWSCCCTNTRPDPCSNTCHAGDLDLGILALPVQTEGLAERKLFDEPFVVAVPEHNPLASRRSLKASGPQWRNPAAAGRWPLPARTRHWMCVPARSA